MMPPDKVRVGYAQRVITPPLDPPVYLAGFGQNRVAQSVHDDLYAGALALSQNGTHIIVVALDLLGLGRANCLEIEAAIHARQPNTEVIVACTHVHHAPDTIGLWGPDMATSGVNKAYLTWVKNTVVEIAVEALQAPRSANIRSVSVQVPNVAKNARNPDVLDEELSCIQFCDTESGKAIATWLIFPCHPEVLWEHNPHITSDYVHTLRERIEAATGAPALFMVGALGGMMTPDVQRHDFDESAVMGETLAEAALNVLSKTEPISLDFLAYSRQIFTIPMQSFLFEEAIRAGLLADVRDATGDVTTETGILKVGSAWFATIPGELLPKIGLQLKTEMQAKGAGLAVVVGLAHDEIGYILPQDEYIYPENPFEPGSHYEETMSIGPETAPRLLDTLRKLLNPSSTHP
jgi:hypothetical protein